MKKQLSSIYEDLKIPDMPFTSHNTPHITPLVKLLLGVCNTKKWGDLTISLRAISAFSFKSSFNEQDVLRRPVRDAAQCPQDAGRGVEVGRSSLQGQL
jgi:hypothetical protein